MTFSSANARLLLLLCAFSAVATIATQWWIGGATLYGDERRDKREVLHESILHNQAPADGWEKAGMRGTNVRIGAVYLAEVTRQATGLNIHQAYKLIDSAFLFVGSVMLACYLRHWFTPTYCTIGLLYFWSVLGLTYLMHYFHPWDRPMMVFWIALLALIRADRPGWLLLLLPIATAFKNDVIFLPALYFMTWVSRENAVRITSMSFAMAVASVGTFVALSHALPGEPATQSFFERTLTQVGQNIERIAYMGLTWPPLYFHGPLLLLAIVGIFRRNRFQIASMIFGVVFLIAPWFLASRFHEVRAQIPLLLLLLPLALITLREWFEQAPQRQSAGPS